MMSLLRLAKFKLAKYCLVTLLGSLAVSAQQAAPKAEPARGLARATFLAKGEHILADGEFGDWPNLAPALVLDKRSQIWGEDRFPKQPWRGKKDLSAEIYIAYDPAHLFIRGRIHDDFCFVPEAGAIAHNQDAVEIFLHFGALEADEDGVVPFNAESQQLFISPFAKGERWHNLHWSDRAEGTVADIRTPEFTGVELGYKQEVDGYSFEIVLPFTNFPAMVKDVRKEIAFGIAVDDFDVKGDRYQYMTWNGKNPVDGPKDASKLGRLIFGEGDPLPMADSVRVAPMGVWSMVRDYWLHLVGALCGAAVLFLLFRFWSSASAGYPGVRRAVRVLGVSMFLLGLVLPGWLESRRRQAEVDELSSVVAAVEPQIAEMAKGALGTFRGSKRDRPLVDLLAGESIVDQPKFRYTLLQDLVDQPVGASSVTYAEGDFDIRPYWIPLSEGRGERFDFQVPLEAGQLVMLVARERRGVLDPDVGFDLGPVEPRPARLHVVSVSGDEEAAARNQSIDFAGQFTDCEFGSNRERFEVAHQAIAYDGELGAVTITAPDDSSLWLVGMTWVSEDNVRFEALNLGDASTGLRGQYPELAGFQIGPKGLSGQGIEESLRIRIPGSSDSDFRKLSLYYSAQHSPNISEQLGIGDEVGRLEIYYHGSNKPTVVKFEHQGTVFYETDRYNTREPDESENVSVHYTWEEDDESHIELVREIYLAKGKGIKELRFINLGFYELRFRSIVLGRKIKVPFPNSANFPLKRSSDSSGYVVKPAVLDQLNGADFAIYRGGRLTESTLKGEAARTEFATGPTEAEDSVLQVYEDEALVSRQYRLQTGDDWAGAVLGVFRRDTGFAKYVRSVHFIGMLLCLLSVPILLLLFSEVLSVLNNLRFRLVAVLSVATLIPLGILSLVLVRVLESGHESDLRSEMVGAVETVADQLDDAGRRLDVSGRAWLDDLATQFRAHYGKASKSQILAGKLKDVLKPVMLSQMPPEWQGEGGFLRFEFHSKQGDPGALRPFTIYVGSEALKYDDTPLRSDPGVYLVGKPILGVRCDLDVEMGTCSLAVARLIDDEFLAGLAPTRGIVLTNLEGYPLSVADASSGGDASLRADLVRPDVIRSHIAIKDAVLSGGQAQFQRYAASARVAAYSVLRDLQEKPRFLLGLFGTDRAATLPLQMGDVPVRTFFFGAATSLLLLAVFLSFLVTSRITGPIDRLEEGAQSLSRGELDVRIDTEERGQIGRLTRTFNQMAQDLRSRIEDLRLLNRGNQELTAKLELSDTLTGAIGFFARHSPADGVRILLVDSERERLEVFGGAAGFVEREAEDVTFLFSARGPVTMKLEDKIGDRVLPRLFHDYRSLVALPLVFAGRTHGVILLLFESAFPNPMNMDLLWTMAVQTSAAIENARLYRHAVEDMYTGAYRPEFFRRRLVQEVGRAQARGQRLALAGLVLCDGPQIAEALGIESYGRYLERFVTEVRGHLGGEVVVCRAGDHEFQILILDADKESARDSIDGLLLRLTALGAGLPVQLQRLPIRSGVVTYPEDAASAEFLFDALDSDLEGGEVLAGSGRARMKEIEGVGLFLDSPAMEGVIRTLERVAPTDLTLLLEGETGTGKEVLTNVIHQMSKRASGPLVKVHCASLSESLLQSELFGHEKGAFTGAVERKLGRFERAQGGTIFLDEIGEISLEVQVQLLRVLQEREIERVGGSEPVRVDVRVIAATNRNIAEMVEQGIFREDLYFRLQGMVIRVPPLRERKSEIPGLIELFLREAVGAGHTAVSGFGTDAIDELFRMDWPGNIRELRNMAFRAMVFARGDLVTVGDLYGQTEVESQPIEAVVEGSGVEGSGAEESGVEPVVEISAPPRLPPASEPVGGSVEAAAVEPSVTLPRPEAVTLTDRQRALLRIVRERGSVSTQEYGRVVGVSARTALRDLATLAERGVLERSGKRRGARYQLAIGLSIGTDGELTG